MKRFALVAVVLVAGGFGTAALLWAAGPSPAQDDQPISGAWQVAVALRNGQRYEDTEVANWVWRFDGHDSFTWEGAPPDLRADFGPALVACNESTEPKQIDFKHLAGPHENRITLGIYAFAGSELLVNVPLVPDGERPGGFGPEWFPGNLTVSLHPVRR
jgi:uncharacterized protein (TIGR03067 family)